MPGILGLHHRRVPVAELDRGIRFHRDAMGATRIAVLDPVHPDGRRPAAILSVSEFGTLLELRLDPGQARRQAGFDPVTPAVRDRADSADLDLRPTKPLPGS